MLPASSCRTHGSLRAQNQHLLPLLLRQREVKGQTLIPTGTVTACTHHTRPHHRECTERLSWPSFPVLKPTKWARCNSLSSDDPTMQPLGTQMSLDPQAAAVTSLPHPVLLEALLGPGTSCHMEMGALPSWGGLHSLRHPRNEEALSLSHQDQAWHKAPCSSRSEPGCWRQAGHIALYPL